MAFRVAFPCELAFSGKVVATTEFFHMDPNGERPKAVVVAVQTHGVDALEFASSIAELERLAATLGVDAIGRVTQKRATLAPGQVLGSGKLKDLAKWTGGTGEIPAYQKPGTRAGTWEQEAGEDAAGDALDAELADDRAELQRDIEPSSEPPAEPLGSDAGPPPGVRAKVVLVDHDLTPTQQRNLEKATGVDVLDRSSVILEIFFRHAKTREARLQVEIARLNYLAPRLRESAGNEDRVRGGVGGKGAGESSLELDRRRIRDRIAELRHELAQISHGAATRRQRRSTLPTVALVGYTNAGKSSLMRALTGSAVYVADKLFATLDTTVRTLQPATHPAILVTDTVGFINKLPHDLVASFRSTLDEANEADLLLHVVDAADPALVTHLEVTETVLRELGAGQTRALLVLNKVDCIDDETRADLELRFPDAILMSAKRPADVAALRVRLIEEFAGKAEVRSFFLPWAKHGVMHEIHKRGTVVREHHEDDGTQVDVQAPAKSLDEIAALLA